MGNVLARFGVKTDIGITWCWGVIICKPAGSVHHLQAIDSANFQGLFTDPKVFSPMNFRMWSFVFNFAQWKHMALAHQKTLPRFCFSVALLIFCVNFCGEI